MVIRPAHPSEGERLREITAAAKGFWGYDAERVRAWAAALDLSPERLAGADVLVAELDGIAVGWAEILPPDAGVCVLEHLWVEPARMRRGAGVAALPPGRRACRRPGRDRDGVGGRAERARVLCADGRPAGAHEDLGVGPRAHGDGRAAVTVIQMAPGRCGAPPAPLAVG